MDIVTVYLSLSHKIGFVDFNVALAGKPDNVNILTILEEKIGKTGKTLATNSGFP